MSTSQQILIVDDSEESVVFISEILEDHGFNYSVARNGAEALEAMKERRPDLVLLDIMMPRKSGVNVFRQMKKNPELETVPIIFITGASRITGVDMKTGEQQSKETYEDDFAREFGATMAETLQGLKPEDLIEKPFDPPVLVAKIKEFLP